MKKNWNKTIFLGFVRVVTLPFLIIGFTLVLFVIGLRAVSGDKEAEGKILTIKEEIKNV